VSVTFSWVEFNGASGSQTETLLTNLNFGNADLPNLVTTSYPVAAGSNSYVKYLCGEFSGSFTQISNLKFWKASGSYVTGESIAFTGSIAYSTPDTTSTGDDAVPTAQPSVPNVAVPHFPPNGPGGVLNGPASGSRTAFMRLQLSTTSSSPAGATNTKTFALTYDRQ
jgi:hypothetical protein